MTAIFPYLLCEPAPQGYKKQLEADQSVPGS